jgi:large subunit ribosomal protein L22
MEQSAKVTGVRIAPRKVRLVIDQVRGKKVSVALGLLENLNKSSSIVVSKLIKSAVANAVNNKEMKEDDLFIKTIYVNEGPRLKRYMPRAKGSANSIIKRTSHVTVVLSDAK